MKKPILYVLAAIAVVVALIYYNSRVPEENAPPEDPNKEKKTLTADEQSTLSDLNNEMVQNTVKALLSGYAEHFEYTPEHNMLNITKIILPNIANMNCLGDEKLYEEIKKLIGDNQLIFNSNEECREGNYVNKYRILQKGTIKIGDNDHNASLYYNDNSRETERKAFEGIIIIELSTITSSLPEGELIITTKK